MILVTSSTTAGSWRIRGAQLGTGIGALAVPEATAAQIAVAEKIVIVKKASASLMGRIKAAKKRPVLDVVDPWPQPAGNAWDGQQAAAWLKAYVKGFDPAGIVCTTAAMRHAVSPWLPAIVLPHHARPNQTVNPIRQYVRSVGYEGSARYLDGWRGRIEGECARRGWLFVLNPKELAAVDIVVAFRGGPWRGWATDKFKSNVKLANAQATGTPIILLPELGSTESASGGEVWIEEPGELPGAFDLLTPLGERASRATALLAAAPRLDKIAERYRRWLASLDV